MVKTTTHIDSPTPFLSKFRCQDWTSHLEFWSRILDNLITRISKIRRYMQEFWPACEMDVAPFAEQGNLEALQQEEPDTKKETDLQIIHI